GVIRQCSTAGLPSSRGWRRLALHPLNLAPQFADHLALLGAALDVLTLVVVLLTAGQRELAVQATIDEVQLQRNQSVVAVAYLAHQRVNLATVQQQLTHASRGVVPEVAAGVLRDMQPPQPDLSGIDGGISVHEAGLALPQGLDLCADENIASLATMQVVVVVARLAVCRNPVRPPDTWGGGLLPLRPPGIHRGALLSHDCSHVTSRAVCTSVGPRSHAAS